MNWFGRLADVDRACDRPDKKKEMKILKKLEYRLLEQHRTPATVFDTRSKDKHIVHRSYLATCRQDFRLAVDRRRIFVTKGPKPHFFIQFRNEIKV